MARDLVKYGVRNVSGITGAETKKEKFEMMIGYECYGQIRIPISCIFQWERDIRIGLGQGQ